MKFELPKILRRGLLLSLPLLLLTVGTISFLTTAQSPDKERKLTQKHFENMPVAIHQVRNLNKGESWFSDLEIEVKNVSEKPIYFISVYMEFPDIPAPVPQPREDGRIAAGASTGFPLTYGDSELIDVARLASPDDVPLQLGETYILRVPKERLEGLASMKRRIGFSDEATKHIIIALDTVSFGDGSGYIAGRKVAYPKKSKKKVRN